MNTEIGFVGNAWAQDVTGTAAAGAEPPSAGGQIVLFLIILTIFYFFLIRPQQKRLKEHSQMVSALRRGDRVVTGGGIIGSITKVEDTEVHVEIAPNVRIRVVKGTITEVLSRNAPADTEDKKAKARKEKQGAAREEESADAE